MELEINVPVDYTPTAFAAANSYTPGDWGFSTPLGPVSQPPGTTVVYMKFSGTPTTVGAYAVRMERFDDYGAPVQDITTTVNVFDPAVVPEPEPEPEPTTPTTPTGKAVAAFLAQAGDTALEALATQHATIITAMAYAYTRGVGFTEGVPNPAIESVIIMATARLVANPEQLDITVGSTRVGRGFQGWNLSETLVLNLYRRRAG